MPFITLDNSYSNLASYYNNYANRPDIPKTSDQFKAFDDGLIRGGVLNTALAVKKDVINISNFLYNSNKGPLFIIKQVGLHLTNPLLEQKGGIKGGIKSLIPTRIYNGGVNTLASVAGTAFGLHFPKFGLLPTANYDYAKIAKDNNDNSVDDSTTASVNPPNIKITPYDGVKNLEEVIVTSGKKSKRTPSPYTNKPNRLISYLGKLTENGTSTNPVTLQSYLGGPDSVYGLVNTRIRTTGDNVTNKNTKVNGFTPLSYRSIYNIGNELKVTNDTSYINYYYGPGLKPSVKTSTSYQPVSVNPNGFSPFPLPDVAAVKTQTLEINTANTKTYLPLEYTYGVSHAGKQGTGYQYSVDSINAINITDSKTFYGSVTKKASEVSGLYSDGNVEQTSIFGKDIIKFRIELLNNNQIVNDKQINTEVYAFRAYLNDLSDGVDAKWDSYRYMGRGEEFFVYNGFTRDISLGFTVFAHSKQEMKPLYQKINNLMSSFTPDYSAAGLMRGNIGYLTVGDYLYRVPGVFTSMKISNLLETHWETNIDGDSYELPKLMNIALSFKPIHSFVPRRNYAGKEKSAFITPDVNSYSDTGVGDVSEGKLSNKFIPAISRKTTS